MLQQHNYSLRSGNGSTHSQKALVGKAVAHPGSFCISQHKVLQGAQPAALGVRESTSAAVILDNVQRSRRGATVVAAVTHTQGDAAFQSPFTADDLVHLEAAATLSTQSAGLTQPHPNAACLLVDCLSKKVLASAFQRAQGTVSAEVQAVQALQSAGGVSVAQQRQLTAYCNLEPGDCHGEAAAVKALLAAGVTRVVIGLRSPLPHLRGVAVTALRAAGVTVDVLSDRLHLLAAYQQRQQQQQPQEQQQQQQPAASRLGGAAVCINLSALSEDDEVALEAELSAMMACLRANEAVLHRAVLRRPLSVLKYAMTLDGKIATGMGHSAWVSSAASRALVFEARARSDAVIVGGNTVRRDNPRLTTRLDHGHMPCRIVMSRSLDLPEDASLWDVANAPTIVMTQKGARRPFQTALRARGVEVVEFDFLTPENVAHYCYERGFLQCFWECGGTLAAPTISSSVIHKVMAFVAPKIIGGIRAPTPVGELGFVEMTQALDVIEPTWKQVGPDVLCTGYLPASGGLLALASSLDGPGFAFKLQMQQELAVAAAARNGNSNGTSNGNGASTSTSSTSSASRSSSTPSTSRSGGPGTIQQQSREQAASAGVPSPLMAARTGSEMAGEVCFYKAWDRWGALSNFSPHPIRLPVDPTLTMAYAATPNPYTDFSDLQASASTSGTGNEQGTPVVVATREWPSVEHFYQAHKFSHVASSSSNNSSSSTESGSDGVEAASEAVALMEEIAAAPSPEEAARIGRRAERKHPDLVRPDWAATKKVFMCAALRAKFLTHEGPRAMLLSTCNVGASTATTDKPLASTAAAAAGVSGMIATGATLTSTSTSSQQQQRSTASAPSAATALQTRPDAPDTGRVGAVLMESSPHDTYWGTGYDRRGQNHLGRLLMKVRSDILQYGPEE